MKDFFDKLKHPDTAGCFLLSYIVMQIAVRRTINQSVYLSPLFLILPPVTALSTAKPTVAVITAPGLVSVSYTHLTLPTICSV